MAKAAAKTSSKTESKPRVSSTKSADNSNNIEQVTTEVLEKLQELGIEEQLQRDLQWCLGSYRADHNPIGLLGIARQALLVLQAEKEKKTKGVTAKLIKDLEKIVKEQP
ncbi:MAG: hypothetical protein WA874_01355 [Chryseosolibacter sp.]